MSEEESPYPEWMYESAKNAGITMETITTFIKGIGKRGLTFIEKDSYVRKSKIKAKIKKLSEENKKLEERGDGDSLSILYKKNAKNMKVQLKFKVTQNNAKIDILKEVMG